MTTVALNESGSVTFDGSGNGKLQMKPLGGADTWLPVSVSFKASSNTKEAACRIYIGPNTTDQYFVDGSLSGSTGDSTGRVAGYQVDTHGNTLWAVWSGGDAGAAGTLQVTGTEVQPGGAPFDLSQMPQPGGSGCANPIIGGGGALVYPSIHSPNFLATVSGWSINKDGTAEFNSVIIRNGTIVSGTALYYSAAPAAGDLLTSISGTAGTDPFGNAYLAGTVSYAVILGTAYAVQLINGTTGGIGLWICLTGQAGPYVRVGAISPAGIDGVRLTGAGDASSADFLSTQVTLWKSILGQANAAITLATGATPAAPGSGATLYTLGNIFKQICPSGLAGIVPVSQGDHSVIACAQVAAKAITKAWSIPAAASNVDTVWRLTAWGFGALGSTLENLTWGIGLDGAVIRSVIVASPGLVSQSFRWRAVIDFHIVTTGAGGTADCILSGSWGSAQATTTEAAVTCGSPSAGAEAIDTTIAHTLELMPGWASTTGAPTITCIGSTFERAGA